MCIDAVDGVGQRTHRFDANGKTRKDSQGDSKDAHDPHGRCSNLKKKSMKDEKHDETHGLRSSRKPQTYNLESGKQAAVLWDSEKVAFGLVLRKFGGPGAKLHRRLQRLSTKSTTTYINHHRNGGRASAIPGVAQVLHHNLMALQYKIADYRMVKYVELDSYCRKSVEPQPSTYECKEPGR